MTNLLTSSFLRTFAIVALSVVSIRTTSFGFIQYFPSQELVAWTASLAIQVVVVGSVFILTDFSLSRALRWPAMALYAIALFFSVSGSFLEFDNWLARGDREARNTRQVQDELTAFQNGALRANDVRIVVLEKELATINRMKLDEGEMGIASHKGSGQGPMFRTFQAISDSLDGLKNRFETASNSIQACGTSNSGRLDREGCAKAVDCVATWIAKAPNDESVHEALNAAHDLLRRTKYGSVFSRPSFEYAYPVRPAISVARAGSMEELFDGSLSDLRECRITSLVALAGAILIDLLILMIALVESLVHDKTRTEKRPADAERFVIAKDRRRDALVRALEKTAL